MFSPMEVKPFYVETNYNNGALVVNAMTIIRHVGQDPGAVQGTVLVALHRSYLANGLTIWSVSIRG